MEIFHLYHMFNAHITNNQEMRSWPRRTISWSYNQYKSCATLREKQEQILSLEEKNLVARLGTYFVILNYNIMILWWNIMILCDHLYYYSTKSINAIKPFHQFMFEHKKYWALNAEQILLISFDINPIIFYCHIKHNFYDKILWKLIKL